MVRRAFPKTSPHSTAGQLQLRRQHRTDDFFDDDANETAIDDDYYFYKQVTDKHFQFRVIFFYLQELI